MKGITSPEGIIMLMVAATLDVIGIIIFLLGTWFAVDDYGILEVVATAIIGTWMFIRYSSLGSEGGMKVAPQEDGGEGEGEEEGESNEKEGSPEKEKKEEEKNENASNKEAPKEEGATGGTPKKSDDSAKPEKGTAKAPVNGKKGGNVKDPKEIIKDKIKDKTKELIKKTLKRFGLTFLIELVPFLGGFWPGWIIFVWKEMREEPSKPKEAMTKPKKTQGGRNRQKEPLRGGQTMPRDDQKMTKEETVRPKGSQTMPRDEQKMTKEEIVRPKGSQTMPREDQPMPREDQPMPQGDQPMPQEDQPMPQGDQPMPQGDQPMPQGDRSGKTSGKTS